MEWDRANLDFFCISIAHSICLIISVIQKTKSDENVFSFCRRETSGTICASKQREIFLSQNLFFFSKKKIIQTLSCVKYNAFAFHSLCLVITREKKVLKLTCYVLIRLNKICPTKVWHMWCPTIQMSDIWSLSIKFIVSMICPTWIVSPL